MLRLLIFLTKITFASLLLGAVVLAYIVYHFSRHLPDYSQLKEYHPPCVTRVYTADGKLMEEYAKEKRIFVPIKSVPEFLVHAFIAAEDKNFYSHPGIDIFSIFRAAFANISHAMHGTRFEGGSTITQQVVKNFLLSSERSIERKIKEAMLSYMVTQTFTKDQILELYLNQLFLGKGYGVAAAALGYFNKSVEELSIAESAFLASLPKSPSQYGAEKNYKKALARRNYVIKRMLDDGYIGQEEAKASMDEPINLIKQDKIQTIDAGYYAEQVRMEVINLFGEEYFYTAGLEIITCADAQIQQAAAAALHHGIKAWDMKKGYRGPLKNILLTNWQQELAIFPKPIGLKDYTLAVMLEVSDIEAKIGFADGKKTSIKLSDMGWTRTSLKSIKTLLKKGDVIVVEHEKDRYKLRQIPEINGGIIVMEPNTGRVLATEGGYDYDHSKFDRTRQAKRQPGSLIKPFVYLTGLEQGIKPNDIFEDAPIGISPGPGLPLWTPKNWDSKFMGPMTFRKGLEKSRNTVTVRVSRLTGIQKIADTIKKFGINDNPARMPSIVLGALETTLERMSTAFCIMANQGRQVTPHYIEVIKDRNGNVIYRRNDSECQGCTNTDVAKPPTISKIKDVPIIDEATNYQMVSILSGAIQRGTGGGAKILNKIIAGKTGTSNEGKDAWFVGFTPKILVGTYVGYDLPKTMGKSATGATVALPIFIEFMKNGYKNTPSLEFTVPDNIDLVLVNYDTGLPVDNTSITATNYRPVGKEYITEAFKVNNYRQFFEDEIKQQEPIKTNDEVISQKLPVSDQPLFPEIDRELTDDDARDYIDHHNSTEYHNAEPKYIRRQIYRQLHNQRQPDEYEDDYPYDPFMKLYDDNPSYDVETENGIY